MKLYEAIEKLYDVLALDKNIAKEILKDLVEDEAVCFMLSIAPNFTKTNTINVSRGGQNANINYQLSQLLHNVNASNKVFNSYFKTLDIKTQVVLKELLNVQGRFDSTTFYGYAKKVYSKREILDYLVPSAHLDESIRYFISNSKNYYFKTRTTKVIHNNVPKGLDYREPTMQQTALYNEHGINIANGSPEFGAYLKGIGPLPEITGHFKTGKSLTEIQYALNKMAGDKFAIVFHRDGIVTLTKESLKLTSGIIDFILSDDFEVIGVWIEYRGNVYELPAHVPQTMIDGGLDKYVATFKANELVSGKLNNIEFVKFNLKEIDESK